LINDRRTEARVDLHRMPRPHEGLAEKNERNRKKGALTSIGSGMGMGWFFRLFSFFSANGSAESERWRLDRKSHAKPRRTESFWLRNLLRPLRLGVFA
jgi:hypothetical protein